MQSIVPHHPQLNSLNERVHRAIYNAARAALSHAKLSDDHSDSAGFYATFKYNNLPHTSTKQIPYNVWRKTGFTFKHFKPFAQYGTVLNGNIKSKLVARSEAVQYLYPVDQNQLLVCNIHTGKKHKVRALDFKPCQKHPDAATLQVCIPKTFKTSAAAYNRRAPTSITPATPAPTNPSMAQKYPDSSHWSTAQVKKLDQLDNQKVVIWCYNKADLPAGSIFIPPTMHYGYKRNKEGSITSYKSLCAARGDKLVKFKHYDPEEVITFTTDKTMIRFLLSLVAKKYIKLEHYDITSAFTH